MRLDDAILYTVQVLRSPDAGNMAAYGYDVYMPRVIMAYFVSIGRRVEHGSEDFVEASPAFLSAGWELCRRGILRPGVKRWGAQATDDGSAGAGYAITPFGRSWLDERDGDIYVPTEPERFAEMITPFRRRFGAAFNARAQEAIRCYGAHAYLACCAMCGAAAESIVLTLAATKLDDADAALRIYRAANGRQKIENIIVGKASAETKRNMDSVFSLLKYWRDASAHGAQSSVGDNEAFTSLALLLRYATYVDENWGVLLAGET